MIPQPSLVDDIHTVLPCGGHFKSAPDIPMEKEDRQPEIEDWFRAKVGAGKQIQIFYKGPDDIGPKEIQKLIDILAAQKAALDD